jgi:putative MFS transporter
MRTPMRLKIARSDTTSSQKIFSPTVLISGLGYFVDIYDLLLFGIVRSVLFGSILLYSVANILNALLGGVMRLLPLVIRLSIYESTLFQAIQNEEVRKADFRMLFCPWSRFFRYLRCIFVGVPIWFAIGIPITFSPKLAKELHVKGAVTTGKSILFCYLGASVGNIICGLVSQKWKS